MKYTLDNFYKSREWETFRAVLMNERTNADGLLICEKCGKPITRRYDCIAHHKVALTEDNVNDALVAFNPDNITLIHFKCHNAEHDRFQGWAQHVYLVYGSPCSGKSSWVKSVARDDDLILDIDKIWDAICIGGWEKKTGRGKRLLPNVFGIRDCIIDQIRTRTGTWRSAYIIGGYPLRTDRDRLCDLLKAEPIYIEATIAECLERAKTERPEGWERYILDWFENFVE